MSTECQLDTFNQKCCCDCKHRHNDYSHPSTDGGKFTHRRGYICACITVGNRSGWSEHGLCEVWQQRESKPVITNKSTAIDIHLGHEWDSLYSED